MKALTFLSSRPMRPRLARVSSTGETLRDLTSLAASRWESFWRVRWQFALPYLFAGARVAVPLSLIGAVVSEWTGAERGLGRAVLLTAAVGLVERRMLYGTDSGKDYPCGAGRDGPDRFPFPVEFSLPIH